MTKKDRKVILFPGTYTRLIEEAEEHARNYKFQQAVTLFDEAFQYYDYETVRDNILYTYAYSLYEVKETARARDVCEYVISGKAQSIYYFEFVELFVSVCIDLRDYKVARDTIEKMLQEGYVPQSKVEQFEHLRTFIEKVADKTNLEQYEVQEADEEFNSVQFFTEPPEVQLFMLQQLMAINIRPYAEQLKLIIERDDTHPFVKSIALILLVEQQVDIEVTVEKFGQSKLVNPAELALPTKLPQFAKVQAIVADQTEQDPTIYTMIEQLIAKHSIVTYPFEWLHFHEEDVAFSYIDYVHTMFGNVREMDYEIVEFLQTLEKLTELQQM